MPRQCLSAGIGSRATSNVVFVAVLVAVHQHQQHVYLRRCRSSVAAPAAHSDSVPSSVAANQRSGGLQSVKARHDKDVGGCCLPTEGTEEDRRDQHWHMASKLGFAGFGCHCSIASARGATSCIDIFGKEQFRRWHNETYIIPVTRDNSSPSLMNAVQTSIHQKIWGLKAPATDTLGGQDRYGRKYVISKPDRGVTLTLFFQNQSC